MGHKWPVLSLREAGVALIDCEHRTPPAAPSGYPYIAIPQMKQGRLDLADARRITAEHFAEWTKKARPRTDDVILSRRCNPGETVVVPTGLDCALGQNLVLLRADGTKVHAPFLRWLVRGPEWWNQIGKFLNAGAIFDSLKCADVPNFRLSIPPLPEQRAIAGVLGALDDKIEVNRKTARVLEGIARAVFTSWFVDFDPVRRRAASDPGSAAPLPADLAVLFPKRLVDSPIGDVPEGWRVEPMSEHFDAIRGLSYRGSGLADSGMPMHNLNSVYEGGGYKYPGIKFYSGEYRDRHMLDAGDVIVANTEQGHDHLLIGYPAIVPKRFGDKGLFSHHLYRVRPRAGSPLTARYIYQAMMTPRLRDEIIGHTNGTTVNMLSISGLEMSRVVVPPAKLLQRFDALAKAILDRIELTHDANPTLAALRDALLPKLISGELRIADAEKIVGNVS